jgi:hypothetical protein
MEVRPSGMVAWKVLFESDPAKDCDNSIQNLIRTSGGGYLATGTVAKRVGLGHRPMVMKLSHSGSVQWVKSYILNEWLTYGDAAIELRDGGYIVAGTAGGTLLLGLDPSGNVEWHKNLAASLGSLHATADGGFVACGSTDDGQAQLLKFTSRGDIVWQRSYQNDLGWSCGDFRSMAYSLCLTSDGGYALAGVTWACSMQQSIGWVCKLDQTGQVAWQNGFFFGAPRVIFQTKDGGYLVCDSKNMVKLSAALTIHWQKTFADFTIYSAFQSDEGGFVLSGFFDSSGAGDSRMGILCLDGNGMIGPSCSLVSTGDIEETGSSMIVAASSHIGTLQESLSSSDLKYSPYPRAGDVETLCVFGQMPRRRPDSGQFQWK